MGFLSNLLESGISMASNAVEKKTAENLAESNPKEMSYYNKPEKWTKNS